jgi:hypothetical protein
LAGIATGGLGQMANKAQYLKSSSTLYNQFSKSTKGMFKGLNHNQLRSKAYKQMIKMHNFNVNRLRNTDDVLSGVTKGINFIGVQNEK